MRTIRLTALFVALIGGAIILAAQLGAFESDPVRLIPLKNVYATFAQEELRPVEDAVDQETLAQVLNADREMPRRIALCVGNDVNAAVRASAKSFALPEEGVPSVEFDSNHALWLAAYLGVDGSVPIAYRVESVEIMDRIIRVTYQRKEASGRSCDLHEYLLWAPLNRVESGFYTLELFDSTMNTVTASRMWQVIAK
jgi:hypothetical protein